MKLIITPREAMDGGYWGDLCDLMRINLWAIHEGLMGDDEKIVLTSTQTELLLRRLRRIK